MKGQGAWSIFSHTTEFITALTQYSYCLGKILLLLCKQHSTKILFYTTGSFTSKAHEIPFSCTIFNSSQFMGGGVYSHKPRTLLMCVRTHTHTHTESYLTTMTGKVPSLLLCNYISHGNKITTLKKNCHLHN
jgi:hypothetical protein